MAKVNYYANDKRLVFVGQGLGAGESGKPWMTLYQKWPYHGGTHRLKSPQLPLRGTEEEAQDDLDKYAASHNFEKTDRQLYGNN